MQGQEYTEEFPCQLWQVEYKEFQKCKEEAHIQAMDPIHTSNGIPSEMAFNDFWKNKQTVVGPLFSFYYMNMAELNFPELRKAGSVQRSRNFFLTDTDFYISNSLMQRINFPKLEHVTIELHIEDNEKLLEVNFGKGFMTNRFTLSYNNKLNEIGRAHV